MRIGKLSYMNNSLRCNQLQGLRALSFLAVFGYHSTLVQNGMYVWGVSVFFILSGFLISYHHYEDKVVENLDLKRLFIFTYKRVKRIYPLFLVTLIFAILFEAIRDRAMILEGLPATGICFFAKIITNVLLISDWFPRSYVFSEFNIVTWFLSAIVLFWFVTPIIINKLKKIERVRGIKGLLFTAAIVYIIQVIIVLCSSYIIDDNYEWFIYEHPFTRIEDYIIGCIAGSFYYRIHKDNIRVNRVVLGMVAIVLNAISLAGIHFISNLFIYRNGIYFTVPVCLLIIALMNENGILSRILSFKPLVGIGNLSGNAYLIHVVVINGIHGIYKRLFSADISLLLWVVLSFVISMSLAILWNKLMSKRKYR